MAASQRKCPYCVSEIDANAIVCPICSRDLNFLTPIYQELEKTRTTVARELEKSKFESTRQSTKILREVLHSSVLTGLFMIFLLNSDSYPYQYSAIAPPVLMGISSQFLLNKSSNLVRSILIGFVNGMTMVAVLNLSGGIEVSWPWWALVFIIVQPLCYFTAGWLKNVVERILLSEDPVKTVSERSNQLAAIYSFSSTVVSSIALIYSSLQL